MQPSDIVAPCAAAAGIAMHVGRSSGSIAEAAPTVRAASPRYITADARHAEMTTSGARGAYERQRATHDVSPVPSPDAHQRRSGTSVIIHGSLPSEDAALVLLVTLVASGKIELRRIDG